MKTLPITVLAYEGPMARAYLSRLKRAGFRPAAIWLMLQSHNSSSGKPIGRWLPGGLKLRYAEKAQDASHNFWPRRLRMLYPSLFDVMSKEINKICDDSQRLLEEMFYDFHYDNYADHVKRIFVKDYRDESLRKSLLNLDFPTVIYTGGGIVPDTILDIPDLHFIHVHPGCLPFVRGADGLLWSTLLRGHPIASCFFMSKGIDTGHVILKEDFPSLVFDISEIKRPEDQTLYQAIFSFYDPILRAELLVKVFSNNANAAALEAAPQDLSEGIIFHFMHPAIREKALKRIFKSDKTQD